MKNQALFSSKDESEKLKCHLLQFLFGPLRVSISLEGNFRLALHLIRYWLIIQMNTQTFMKWQQQSAHNQRPKSTMCCSNEFLLI